MATKYMYMWQSLGTQDCHTCMFDLFPHIRLTAQDLTYSYIDGCRVPSPPLQLSLFAAQD